eukprot:scaffold32718_cov60-Phaeocystis_antarctica.AAC.2
MRTRCCCSRSFHLKPYISRAHRAGQKGQLSRPLCLGCVWLASQTQPKHSEFAVCRAPQHTHAHV